MDDLDSFFISLNPHNMTRPVKHAIENSNNETEKTQMYPPDSYSQAPIGYEIGLPSLQKKVKIPILTIRSLEMHQDV